MPANSVSEARSRAGRALKVHGRKSGRTQRTRVDKRQGVIDIPRCILLHYGRGIPVRELAPIVGCTPKKLSDALAPYAFLESSEERTRIVEQFRQNEREIVDQIKLTMAGVMIEPHRLATASLRDVTYAFKELFNASRLLGGETTANVGLTRSLLILHAHERPIYEQPAIDVEVIEQPPAAAAVSDQAAIPDTRTGPDSAGSDGTSSKLPTLVGTP